MNYLLTADLHLTDVSLDEYRWKIFDILKEKIQEFKVNYLFILGDCWDRKDRHSAKLLNRVVDSLLDLHDTTQAEIIILAGNHDAPLVGIYYWTFLNQYSGIEYITESKFYPYVWLLPFSPNPVEEWKNLDLNKASAIFMHQPVEGAVLNANGLTLKKAPALPPLPNVPIFSGDIHHYQDVGKITYIGVPYPTHFNESWKNRVILIQNDDFKNYKEIWLDGIKRAIIDVTSSSELNSLDYKKGDQVRIKYKLAADKLTTWPSEQQAIRKWAEEKEIVLASVEASLVGDGLASKSEKIEAFEMMKPEDVVKVFAKNENLDERTTAIGLELIRNNSSYS